MSIEREQQVDAAGPAAASRPGRRAPDRPDVLAVAGNNAVGRTLAGDGAMSAFAALVLPGAVGNAAVQRAVAQGVPPSVQRDGPQLRMPEFTSPFGPTPPDSPYRLQLDPQIEAQLKAMDAMADLLAEERIRAGLAQVTLPPVPNLSLPPGGVAPGGVPLPATPAPVPAAPAAAVPGAVPPGPSPELRAGGVSDIWQAVLADPTLGAAVTRLQDQANVRVREDWAALSTGERGALVSTAVAIGGGAVAGILSNPDSRAWVADTLRGTVYPVPFVPGLGVQLDLGGDSLVVGLHLDLGQLIPKTFGFGPGDADALGSPPNPYATIPTQRSAAGGDAAAPDEDFAGRIAAAGGGAPLAPDVRGRLEQRLDTNLSGVRVHTDHSAARLAAAVDATAFTTGQDIYFSTGAYQPGTAEGQKLLAHEAVHTIQQAAGPVDGTDHGSVSISDPADRFEQEASRVAASATEPAPVATPGRDGGGAAPVQRDGTAPVQRDRDDTATVAAVTWTAPADVTVTGQPLACHGGVEVAAVLSYLAAVLRQQGAALDDDADAALRAMADTVDAESARYASTGPLTASDPSYLTGYMQLAEGLAHQQIEAAVTRCLAQLVVPEGDDERFQSVLDDLAEESHQAFVGANNSRLEGVLGAIEKIGKLDGKIKTYSGRALKVTDRLKDVRQVARLGERIKKINELSKEVGEQVEAAKQVFEIARDVATLAGIDNTSNGTAMMQGINQFSAGIDLVDKTIGRFGKAVPLFGDLWSKWYKPMIDACVKGLNVIARHEEREGREFEILDMMVGESDGSLRRDPSGAPILSAAGLTGGYFPGGQAVLSYVYAVRQGGTPAMSDAVRDYFLDRAEQFNIHQEDEKLEESDWKLLHPSTWTRSGRHDNVAAWTTANIDKVWGLLYGDLGRYVP